MIREKLVNISEVIGFGAVGGHGFGKFILKM